jgi:ribosomal protein S19
MKVYQQRKKIITSFFLGQNVLVYSGNTFKSFIITKEMVGFRFGDFVYPRLNSHTGKRPLKK